jgi:formylglycine-generating enzyme required for sulfatase activity
MGHRGGLLSNVALTIVAMAALFMAALFPALAEKRVALVIGNGAYKNATRLPNPRNDAEDIAAALKRTGFETIVGFDLDKAGMDSATIRFARSAREADVAVFYYSGHAMQFAGINYLMPVDAKLTDEADLRLMSRVDDIVVDLQQAKNLRILVLDSCRDNPLAEDLKRSIGRTRAAGIARGLAKIDSPQGMIVAYATQSGRTADDGTGRNSPYTAAFLKHIEAAEEIGTVFRRVSADVYENTKRTQLPELSLSLIGEFYLKGRPSNPASATAASSEIAALQERLRAMEEQLKKKDESRIAVVAPPVQPATPPSRVQPAVGVFPEPQRGTTPLSPERERALKPKDSFKECEQCPEMVVVPAGSSIMGSLEGESGRMSREGPQHRVTFAKPFAVGKFAVTFDDWDACVTLGGCRGYKPSDEGWGRGTRPAINVSWNDAKAYVAWLSRKTGRTYRLLSESEREYATRAGTTTPFWWGASASTGQANYNGNTTPASASGGGQKEDFRGKTIPVDSFQPNPFGLFQMHGNVWEWIEDCWNDNYDGAPIDGSAWTAGNCRVHVIRGGSWAYPASEARSAFRSATTSDTRDSTNGFRVARTLTP